MSLAILVHVIAALVALAGGAVGAATLRDDRARSWAAPWFLACVLALGTSATTLALQAWYSKGGAVSLAEAAGLRESVRSAARERAGARASSMRSCFVML